MKLVASAESAADLSRLAARNQVEFNDWTEQPNRPGSKPLIPAKALNASGGQKEFHFSGRVSPAFPV